MGRQTDSACLNLSVLHLRNSKNCKDLEDKIEKPLYNIN